MASDYKLFSLDFQTRPSSPMTPGVVGFDEPSRQTPFDATVRDLGRAAELPAWLAGHERLFEQPRYAETVLPLFVLPSIQE
jgi:hypothetical protein